MINWLVFKSSASLSIFLQKEPERLIQGNGFFIKRQYFAKKNKKKKHLDKSFNERRQLPRGDRKLWLQVKRWR